MLLPWRFIVCACGFLDLRISNAVGHASLRLCMRLCLHVHEVPCRQIIQLTIRAT